MTLPFVFVSPPQRTFVNVPDVTFERVPGFCVTCVLSWVRGSQILDERLSFRQHLKWFYISVERSVPNKYSFYYKFSSKWRILSLIYYGFLDKNLEIRNSVQNKWYGKQSSEVTELRKPVNRSLIGVNQYHFFLVYALRIKSLRPIQIFRGYSIELFSFISCCIFRLSIFDDYHNLLFMVQEVE